jgi:hypothetical protein
MLVALPTHAAGDLMIIWGVDLWGLLALVRVTWELLPSSVWPWASVLASLGLSFPACEVGTLAGSSQRAAG